MEKSVEPFDQSWTTLQTRVNQRLADHLDELGADCPPRLREAMAYSLLAGGKRVRPLLVLLGCQACGGDVEDALPAACALEIIHTYSLIHDDLPAMDDDDLRRGQPTCHVKFGEAMAILAGDALLTLAFEILARGVNSPEAAAACCADLASAAGAVGMVGGQVADLAAESLETTSVEHLEAIHRRKTGRLIGVAPLMGARIAGAEESKQHGLETYGKCVGLAFQIADDLLDVGGTAEKMGKGVGKDAARGKLTYPSLLGEDGSRARAGELLDEACRALAPLGEHGQQLEKLAHFILKRDH